MPSINGFSVEPYGSAALATFTVPGTSVRLSLRKEVAPLMLAFAADWHRHVEPLTPGECWGHAYRPIVGSTTWSFHAPGIAMDFNAPRHPLGKVGTFTPAKVTAIRSLLTKYQGAFRWGGNYTGRKDEMHAEIIVTRARALDLQRIITAPAKPKPPASTPTPRPPATTYEPYRKGQKPGSRTVKRGSAGDDVKFVQRWIGRVTVDGYFGPATDARVRAYQKMRGIGVDGIVGGLTWKQMGIAYTGA